MKKILSTLLLALLCSAMPLSAIAAEKPESSVTPYFTYILLTQNTFNPDSMGKAEISAQSMCRSEVTRVDMDISLQQYTNGRWNEMKQWSYSAPGNFASTSVSYYVPKGYTYQSVVNHKAYINGTLVESIQSACPYSY